MDVTPFLWFDGDVEAALEHYTQVFPETEIEAVVAGLEDRFGLSWQIVPSGLPGWPGGPDPAGAGRAREAMLGMTQLEIELLQRAYEGR